MPPTLILDCDPGIDDAIALHVIAAAVRNGDLHLAGIVAAAGNVPIDMTARNAAFLRGRLALDAPVYRGINRDTGIDAHDFHGADGLGGCYEPGHADHETGDGIAWMIEQAHTAAASGSPLTILAVGPLTNVAAALRAEPRLPQLVAGVVVMGGAFQQPGNITQFAEFNFYADANAAADVFESALPLTVIPLDVTHQVLIDDADVDALEQHTGAPTLATRLLRASIACYRKAEGREACIMHDALAAAAVLHPNLVTTTTSRIAITRKGPESGRSQAAADPTSTASVAHGVDVASARRLLLDALSG